MKVSSEILDRAPPHSLDMERAALGCLLLSRDCAARSKLTPDDFYSDAHKKIYAAALVLREVGTATDATLVAEELRRREWLQDVGGLAYLAELCTGLLDAMHFDYYAEKVQGLANKRRLIFAATDALRNGYNGKTSDEAIAEFESATESIRGKETKQGTTLAKLAIEYVEKLQRGEIKRTSLGLGDAVDHAIGGGLSAGEAVILAARPSHCKTAATLQACHYQTGKGVPCLFVNEEMPTEQVGKRTLQFSADMPIEYWGADLAALAESALAYSANRAPCHLIGPLTTVNATVAAIKRYARDGVLFVVVDYLQRLEGPGFNERERIIYASKKITDCAKELQINIVSVAHLKSEIEKRPVFRPTMRDLYGSDMLAKDASVILLQVWPWKLDEKQPKERFQFFVAKVRNQELRTPLVEARFWADRQMILEVEKPKSEYENVPWNNS